MTGPLPSKIITHEHLQPLNDAIQKVKDGMNEAELAIQAGVSGPEVLIQLQTMHDRLHKIKRTYFPGH